MNRSSATALVYPDLYFASVSCLTSQHFFISTAFIAHLSGYLLHPSVTHLDYFDVDESGPSGRPNSIIVCVSFAARPAKRYFSPSFRVLTLHSRVFPFVAISRITADKHNKEAHKHGKGHILVGYACMKS
jgi:hypothetical protein